VDCDCCCDWWRDKRKKRKSQRQASDAKRLGWFGRALGPLNPAGVVLVGEEHVPARSDAGPIGADREVLVVRDEPFGVVVRPATS
jgi:membrane-bound ClpP family serine protease